MEFIFVSGRKSIFFQIDSQLFSELFIAYLIFCQWFHI